MNELLRSISAYLNRVGTYSPTVVAVELLLIGVLVWWAMRFLRGTRGARLLKGAAVILIGIYVVIRLLPKDLGWERIEFLYARFLLFALAAVVVAFQPELRRAFIQIGQAGWFRSRQEQIELIVDALADAATYLSRNKIGAVVAVERQVGLATVAESGTPMNAVVSAELLNTIFFPGSALHDMGVVIRNGRVAAAGCQFPLAESEDVDASLGSRHRAALGLAQESDAVVLVVSEETGRVSLACEGQLYIGLGQENLREMLLSLLAPHKLPRRQKKTDES